MWTNFRLLLFTRYPEAGTTKTRLIPELGAMAAKELQKRLTERVLKQAELLRQASGVRTVVHYTGGNSRKISSWLGPIESERQVEGDLGEKMSSAFVQTFSQGADAVILIGSDIPDITSSLLQQAFSALHTEKIVIGPSLDGGYYLIGLVAKEASRLLPLLFEKVVWSDPDLLSSTLSRLELAGYRVAILPTLRDIDTPEDLPFAREKGLI